MLRLVPVTRTSEAQALIEDKITWQFSLFVMVIEFVAPSGDLLWLKEKLAPDRGYYRMRVQVHLRSAEIAALLTRHKLMGIEIFKDAKGEKLAKGLLEAAKKKVDTTPVETMMIAWPLYIGRQVLAEQRLAGILDLKLKTLLTTVEIAGTMEEIRFCHGALLGAVDKTHSRLLFALGFDQGDVIIVSPGKPPKKGKTS